MTNHVLKTAPEFFFAVKSGAKNFEIRKDDRAFQTGDTVECVYFDAENPSRHWRDVALYGDEIRLPSAKSAPGAQTPFPAPWASPVNGSAKTRDMTPVVKRITFILRGGQYGVEPGYVILGLADNE